MKQKRNYSLTAKERKEKRRAEARKSSEKSVSAAASRESAELAMLESQKRSRRSAIIVGASLCVAVILVLVALIVPVVSYLVNPYSGYDDVIARFKLSNGMVLEYVIDEDEYDTAATNFIFLAKNGYFDNTVFFDAQEGWLRFGGYEQQPYASAGMSPDYNMTYHHAHNASFCDKFSALPNDRFEKNVNKFGYNLYADSNGEKTALLEQKGVLTYLYSDTSTEFQFSYKEQANDQVTSIATDGTLSRQTLKSTMVGHALNDKTVDNLVAISELAQKNTRASSGYIWYPPTPNIYISSVKVYNLDSKKWRDFDFIDYMSEEGANRLRGWTGQV